MTDKIATLEVRDDQTQSFLAPATDIRGALTRYQAMKDFVSEILKEGVDYGVIPGTSQPTLLKPGAEKLCSFFGLVITYQLLDKETDWTGETHAGEPFFYFVYRVRLLHNEILAGEGEGSSNSWEKKYRYRRGERVCPNCGQPTIFKSKPPKTGWYCWTKKGGCGTQFADGDPSIEGQEVNHIPNPDIYDQVNTLQKMAQKRALIAATLNTTNASDWFTQDLEDFVDAGFDILDSSPVTVRVVGDEPPVKPKEPAVSKWVRPMSPEILREAIITKAKKTKPATDKQKSLVRLLLVNFFGDHVDERYRATQYLTGSQHVAGIIPEMVTALYDWMEPKLSEDGSGEYEMAKIAQTELQSVANQYTDNTADDTGQESLS